ncbi:hypothetical protein SAMN04487965_2681 [Microbulbifer donghaiensis]|uniref:Uncharacterized protein n=1 Tax=Microbulbifer donghaiensis TaxID=494016 RepID=A0A1M5EFH5_9GAMM|nr:hypothetical protein [Microbulbifer donghaiensis]SHF77937.1 hypothetical protein SAMN04487965_2681 [Microbulbifer donghaiensis]
MYFEVVFTGVLRDGFTRRRGIEALANQFSLDFHQIKRLLSGARCIVKRTQDRHRAERIVNTLWDGGWHSELYQGDRILWCSSQSQGEGAPLVRAGMIRSFSADSSISLSLPASWQTCDDLNPHALFQRGDRLSHQYVVVLRQDKAELPKTLTLTDYSAAQLQQCYAKVSAGQIHGEPVPLGNSTYATYTVQLSAELGNVPIRYLLGCVGDKSWYYTIFLWCEARVFAGKLRLFEQLIRDFRIEPAPSGRKVSC